MSICNDPNLADIIAPENRGLQGQMNEAMDSWLPQIIQASGVEKQSFRDIIKLMACEKGRQLLAQRWHASSPSSLSADALYGDA